MQNQLEQTEILTDVMLKETYVDRGYRGHGIEGKTQVIIAGQKRGITQRQQTRLKRRNSIGPVIGHMKQDGKLDRCHLKGAIGEAINEILCGAGQNLRKLLAWARALVILWLGILLDLHPNRPQMRPLSLSLSV